MALIAEPVRQSDLGGNIILVEPLFK